jgi:MFS family permease
METAAVMSSEKSRSLILTSLAHFANDGGVFIMPLIIAILASERTVPSLTIVLMPVMFYLSSLLLSLFVAALADRTERPGLMVGFGLGVVSVGLLGLAASLQYTGGTLLSVAVLVCAFVTGLGTGFYHPISAAILQSVYGDKSKGKALGVNGAAGAVGRALYPSLFFVLAASLTNYGTIAFLGVIGFAMSLVVSLGMRRSFQASPRYATRETSPGKVGLGGRITRPLVVLTIVAFVSTFANQGVAAWMPTYLALQKGLGISSSLGFALTGMYAAAIVGQPIFGYLVDRYEKRLVLAISIVGSSISILGYLFSSGIMDAVLLIVLGFFTFSSFPLYLSLASDYVPRRSSSLSNALVWSLGANGGGVVGPAVVGAVALSGFSSWLVAFEIMAVAALVAAAMIGLLRKPLTTSKTPSFGI